MLLLSYQRRLKIITEALELRQEGGRVSHSWCMRVVSHGYGGLGGAGIEVVDGMHAGKSHRDWSHEGRCRSISRVRGDTLMTSDHIVIHVRSYLQGPAGIGQYSWKGFNTGRHVKALVRFQRSRLSLHTMVLHGSCYLFMRFVV